MTVNKHNSAYEMQITETKTVQTPLHRLLSQNENELVQSTFVLDQIIKLAAKNMNTSIGLIKSSICTKIGISLSKSDAQAGIARYHYNYDYNYY